MELTTIMSPGNLTIFSLIKLQHKKVIKQPGQPDYLSLMASGQKSQKKEEEHIKSYSSGKKSRMQVAECIFPFLHSFLTVASQNPVATSFVKTTYLWHPCISNILQQQRPLDSNVLIGTKLWSGPSQERMLR